LYKTANVFVGENNVFNNIGPRFIAIVRNIFFIKNQFLQYIKIIVKLSYSRK
jgi:hypothetical protein